MQWASRSLCRPLALALVLSVASTAAEPGPAHFVVPAKITRYAQRMMRAHDADGDGRLDAREKRTLPGGAAVADADGDGALTVDELAAYLATHARQHAARPLGPAAPEEKPPGIEPAEPPPPSAAAGEGETAQAGAKKPEAAPPKNLPSASAARKFHVPATRLPAGLPDWFRQRDADGDGQLTLEEYAPRPTQAQLDEFSRLDANRDGLVTARECSRGAEPKRSPKGKAGAKGG
jgi:hypothetical protein